MNSDMTCKGVPQPKPSENPKQPPPPGCIPQPKPGGNPFINKNSMEEIVNLSLYPKMIFYY